MYRPLTDSEIQQLKEHNCMADDFSRIKVANEFSAAFVSNTSFSGDIRLGVFGSVHQHLGCPRHSGIYNAVIHNCTIGDDVYIANVAGQIANYNIESGVYIENVGTLAVTRQSTFGNNTVISVMNEGGGRDIRIFDKLSAQFGAMYALFRHREKLVACFDEIVNAYAQSLSSTQGTICKGAQITGAQKILDVNIGPAAVIDCVLSLENGTVASCHEQPAYAGPGVVAHDFIFLSGSVVSNCAKLAKCFVGQCATVSNGFSAENCLVFANSELLNGEACDVFAGPFTVSHHKSTLLLAAMYSFYNAGSGTNKSNHMYRLGPIHQGTCQRGAKTGSNSYIVWPSRVGAFSTVSGKHSLHFDTSSMPFSYIIEDNCKSVLVPGTAIRSCGTLRDMNKWPKRDRRKMVEKSDFIIFHGLSPFTVSGMVSGRSQLKSLKIASNESAQSVIWNGLEIKSAAMDKGIEYYDLGITTYLGGSLIKRLEDAKPVDITSLRTALKAAVSQGQGRWMDLAGLIAPEEVISKLVEDIESGAVCELSQIHDRFRAIYDNYHDYQWNYILGKIEDYCAVSLDKMLPLDLVPLLTEYKFAIERLNILILEDAKKEFAPAMQAGYGFDGETVQAADFAAVQGTFETNEFCKSIRAKIAQSVREANTAINLLQTLK